MKKKLHTEPEDLRRVLFELSVTSGGELEIRLDTEMKPLLLLAVVSALESAQTELKECINWGDFR